MDADQFARVFKHIHEIAILYCIENIEDFKVFANKKLEEICNKREENKLD